MKIRKFLVVFLVLFLCSCIGKRYISEEVDFYSYLGQNYKSYGDYKKENYDWKGAKIFHRKASIVNGGKELKPEEVPTTLNILELFSKDITYEQLSDMRERMMIILSSKNAKIDYPEEAANLQFYYDCWVLEEQLYTKYSQIARCKQGFIDTLAYLEFRLLGLTVTERDLIQKNIDDKNVDVEVFIRPKKYVIYFDFDSSVLTEDSSRVLWEFLKDAQNVNGKYLVKVVGHADRTGAKAYNEKLSKRRTDTIKHYLVKNGIPESVIRTSWQGEIEPQVITNKNYKEELNRRVTITIEVVK